MTAATATRFATYGDELAAAWRAHLAPREPDAPTVVSTFAGAGGSSLGYSMAGFHELLAVEVDPHARECLRRNFPHVPLAGDVTKLDPAALTEPLDVLDGSPPCQGFSTVGTRQLADPRNFLFREYTRLLRAWRPKAFVMENVAAMAAGRTRSVLVEALEALRAAGYRVSVRELDASFYRVPQRRKRLIFVGVRADLDVAPSHPTPMSAALTVHEALEGLRDPGQIRPVTGKAATLVPLLRPGEQGPQALKRAGRKPAYYSICRVRGDAPSQTIIKSATSIYLHPRYNRALGLAELLRLSSFPDAYDWDSSTFAEVQSRIGNCVPPMFMRAIALHVRSLIGKSA